MKSYLEKDINDEFKNWIKSKELRDQVSFLKANLKNRNEDVILQELNVIMDQYFQEILNNLNNIVQRVKNNLKDAIKEVRIQKGKLESLIESNYSLDVLKENIKSYSLNPKKSEESFSKIFSLSEDHIKKEVEKSEQFIFFDKVRYMRHLKLQDARIQQILEEVSQALKYEKFESIFIKKQSVWYLEPLNQESGEVSIVQPGSSFKKIIQSNSSSLIISSDALTEGIHKFNLDVKSPINDRGIFVGIFSEAHLGMQVDKFDFNKTWCVNLGPEPSYNMRIIEKSVKEFSKVKLQCEFDIDQGKFLIFAEGFRAETSELEKGPYYVFVDLYEKGHKISFKLI